VHIQRREIQLQRPHQPHQRTGTCQGRANGLIAKSLTTRLSTVAFSIPQVYGGLEFYPSALEKGIFSEQALKLALAEISVQGVSTRKVTNIVYHHCGTSVSSTHVFECAKLLDSYSKPTRPPLGRICLSNS
jgi:transposase-like protein